jgi:ABC-type sugar transport system ATPase subunit
MPILLLDRLTKWYPGNVRALDGVSLSVDGDELVVLVGPSGCGKTTLLRLLAGLETPTSGRIVLRGRDLSGVAPAQRGVAMVFQDHALYPSRTVRDNLAYPLQLLHHPAEQIAAVVERTSRRLGLHDVLNARPGELSGGQRQRVALGRALVRQPSLFLFDEPLSSLDAGLRRQLRRLIKQVQRESATPAVYVTHDQEEALALADRLVVLDAGRVRQVGPPRAVHDRPADRFVAGFVGSGMNFVEGRLESGENGLELRHAGGHLAGFALPATWSGREVTLGFRPEALLVDAVEGWPRIVGRIKLIEFQGDRVGVTVDTAVGTLLGSFDAAAECREGQEMTLSLPPDRCLWFEPGPDGRALMVDGPACGAIRADEA